MKTACLFNNGTKLVCKASNYRKQYVNYYTRKYEKTHSAN